MRNAVATDLLISHKHFGQTKGVVTGRQPVRGRLKSAPLQCPRVRVEKKGKQKKVMGVHQESCCTPGAHPFPRHKKAPKGGIAP